eukprot:2976796-Pleurochrysis_carterae.AAC.2
MSAVMSDSSLASAAMPNSSLPSAAMPNSSLPSAARPDSSLPSAARHDSSCASAVIGPVSFSSVAVDSVGFLPRPRLAWASRRHGDISTSLQAFRRKVYELFTVNKTFHFLVARTNCPPLDTNVLNATQGKAAFYTSSRISRY